MPISSKGLMDSFNNALKGIVFVFKSQRNIRIHFLFAFAVILLSFFFNIDKSEIILLFVVISFVLVAEIFNSAIEMIINLVTEEYHPIVNRIKNVTAGAVLLSSVNALVVGYLIFFNKKNIKQFLSSQNVFSRIKGKWEYLLFILLGLTIITVIGIKSFFKKGTPMEGGMPSGHSALAFAVVTAVFFISQSLALTALTFLLAILVAESRVHFKLHTIWEVIIGALIGTFFSFLVFEILGKI